MSLNEKIISDLRNINKGCTLGFNLREDLIEISPTLNVKVNNIIFMIESLNWSK